MVSLISCGNNDSDIIKCTNCGEENEITAKYCKSCGESISDDNNNEEENEGGENNNETNTAEVAFDVSKFANVSSQQLIEILGQPDNITQTSERGFTSFPCSLYDYENHELGFLRFDIINDKVTAISINGELPYNDGNVLETLNVKITNDDYFSEGDMYKKWECPTDTIDLIHITIIDNEKNTYKSLSVEFDGRYYREWNLPIFYGDITPGEYSVQTQEFIKSLLDSPKTADFPMLDWEYARNDYYFLVESYVDAKNGFGVEIRHNFSVVYFNDTLIMAYAIFDGIVVANNGYTPTEDIIKDLFDSNDDTSTPSNPSIDNEINVDDCVLYTEEDLPIYIGDEDGITINNITYYFESGSEDSLCNLFFTIYTDKTFANDFYLNYNLYGDKPQNIINRHELIDDYGEYQGEGNCIFSIELTDISIDNYTFSFESIEIEGDSTPAIDLSQVTLTANTTLPIVINTPQGTIEIFELVDPMFMSGDSNETMVLGVLIGIKSDKTIEGVTLKITLTAVNSKSTEEYIIEDLTIYTEEDWISFFSGYFENAVLPIDDYYISFDIVQDVVERRESSEGLVFNLNSSGNSYELIDIGTCTDSVITVDTYNGLPVTRIGLAAFCGCKMDALILGKSVEYIDMCGINACEINQLVIQSDNIKFNKGAFESSFINELIFTGNIEEIDLGNVGYLWGEVLLYFGTSVKEINLSGDISGFIKQINYIGTQIQFEQIIKFGASNIPINYESNAFEQSSAV